MIQHCPLLILSVELVLKRETPHHHGESGVIFTTHQNYVFMLSYFFDKQTNRCHLLISKQFLYRQFQ